MKIRVSIVTVTLNAERFLHECLASVAAQGDFLYEHIIVDGGSTDSTLDIIKEYAANDSRVLWISEPDRGIADAMNKGVKLATGDVINFLHSDDYFNGDTILSSVCEAFNSNLGYAWLTGGISHVSVSGINLGDIRVRSFTFNRLLRGNIILHPATFVSRQVFDKIGGFNIRWKFAMDYDLWLRLGAQMPPLCIDKSLVCFRVHSGSLSTAKASEAFDEERSIRYGWLAGKPLLRNLYAFYDSLKAPVTVWSMRRKLIHAKMQER